jgi:hypothetical protein
MPQSRQNQTNVTPEIEIAWARAVSHAFDDPAYYRYLKADPEKALSDLGADVSGINVKKEIAGGGGLKPTLDTLDDVIDELERTRARLRSALRATYQGGPCQSAQSGTTCPGSPCPPGGVHIHFHPYALSIPSGYSFAMQQHHHAHVQMQGFGSSPGGSPWVGGSPCVALSQVATTRASATRGVAPPQWIGGPPSGAACNA